MRTFLYLQQSLFVQVTPWASTPHACFRLAEVTQDAIRRNILLRARYTIGRCTNSAQSRLPVGQKGTVQYLRLTGNRKSEPFEA